MNAKGFRNIYFIYIAIAAVLGGVVGGSATARLINSADAVKLFLGFFCLTFAIGMPVAVIWWSKVDEAVREAHKWAWFWGGSIGMMLGIVFATVNVFLQGRLVSGMLAGSGFEAYAYETGLLTAVTLSAYGYMAAWGFWWWKHR